MASGIGEIVRKKVKHKIKIITKEERDNIIRLEAYYKWERAGSPFGWAETFWREAEREFEEKNR